MKVDLHLHSTASDGDFTPTELIKKCKVNGLSACAVTDHDTIDGIKEAIETGKEIGIEVIPGVEIACESSEMLAYFFDLDSPELNEFLVEAKKRRMERVIAVLKKIQEQGYDITLEELELKYGKDLLRVHIAYLMIDKGYFKTEREIFDQLFEKGLPCYVPPNVPSFEEVISVIKKAKGLAVLAHPQFLNEPEKIAELLPKLKRLGMVGIETDCPITKPEQKPFLEKVKELAKELDLIETSGSDYHNDHWKGNQIGMHNCGLETLEKLKAKHKELYG
ncbi:MAG: PHP domain-containing protein [archaeon]